MKQIVYVVDDDEDDRFFAQEGLNEHADCEVFFFANGEELLAGLEIAPELPTLVLLDLNMPRMNGFEALTALKRHPEWKSIPVIILTTSSRPADREEALSLGAAAFLTKPADFVHLVELLAAVSPCWDHSPDQ
ncbi:response regulator [Siphonobacter aquaeclarae]|uniref:Response regulator receiver domain-containing protein n=1 Tax=Siphonobacter aquaeclarae TaxID=563176 RepID=A0A1G9Q0V2_9BACT|nr:response regulator [Siphonobacter aquaeclarae]SDM03945.1 Response regulator receiver domain-containing protein [Siphonobacter aquaeclarae]